MNKSRGLSPPTWISSEFIYRLADKYPIRVGLGTAEKLVESIQTVGIIEYLDMRATAWTCRRDGFRNPILIEIACGNPHFPGESRKWHRCPCSLTGDGIVKVYGGCGHTANRRAGTGYQRKGADNEIRRTCGKSTLSRQGDPASGSAFRHSHNNFRRGDNLRPVVPPDKNQIALSAVAVPTKPWAAPPISSPHPAVHKCYESPRVHH